MGNAFDVVRQFEAELCRYTGAPYAVTVNSCTMALLLAVAWHLRRPSFIAHGDIASIGDMRPGAIRWVDDEDSVPTMTPMRQVVEIPKRTYVSVPQSIIHAGGRPTFRDEEWVGYYDLRPLHVFDCARYFTSGMWYFPPQGVGRPVTPNSGYMMCLSFHWCKTLGIQQGGAILHDSPAADVWLRRARFDGRTEGVAPKDDRFDMIGWHCYMSPEIAAEGLVRLSHLPKHNAPLPNDDYPDLSQMEVFR